MNKLQKFKSSALTKVQKQQLKAGKGKSSNQDGCNNIKVKCEIIA